MRFLKFAVLTALFVLPVSSVNAGIIFNAAVDFNFSNINGALTDINDVTDINFGSQNADHGRIALNGTDNDFNGFLSDGDSTNLVGHALIDQVSTLSGDIDPLDDGQAIGFNLVGVLRNVTGEMALVGGPFPGLKNQFDGGFVDIYLDLDPETPFDPADIATSVDDQLVATFQVTGGETSVLSPINGNTKIFAKLINNTGGFFGLQSGLDPTDSGSQLFIQIDSQDEVLNGQTISGISGGANGGIDIGTDFNPDGFLDIVSTVDGNADFGVVPEPTAVVIWAGAAAIGLCPRRRRRS